MLDLFKAIGLGLVVLLPLGKVRISGEILLG